MRQSCLKGETLKSDVTRTPATTVPTPSSDMLTRFTCETELSQGATPMETQSVSERGVGESTMVISGNIQPGVPPVPKQGMTVRKSVGMKHLREASSDEKFFMVQSPSPASKKAKRRAMIEVNGKIKSWVGVLKATWTVWSPQSSILQELKSKIIVERLPAIKDTDIELLLDAIRSEQGTTQWRVDLDVLMGLVLVIDQGAFNKVWDTFAQSFSAWLRGSDTRIHHLLMI